MFFLWCKVHIRFQLQLFKKLMSGNILNNTVTKYVSHLKFSNSLIYNYHNYTSNQITTNIFLPKQKNTVFLLCQVHNILCKKNYCIHIIIIMIPAINMIHKNCVPQKFKCLPKKYNYLTIPRGLVEITVLHIFVYIRASVNAQKHAMKSRLYHGNLRYILDSRKAAFFRLDVSLNGSYA